MIYGYIRVSTDKQTSENQLFEITEFAEKNEVVIDKWIKETISSREELGRRKLGRLLKKLKSGDIIVASELSRLGRNLLQVMGILNYCMAQDVQVWTIKDNYRLGTDIQSKVLAFAFGLSAEIERDLISQRTKEALYRLKSEGKNLGRPKGKRNIRGKLTGKEDIIAYMLQNNKSPAEVARALCVSRMTISRFLKKHSIDELVVV